MITGLMEVGRWIRQGQGKEQIIYKAAGVQVRNRAGAFRHPTPFVQHSQVTLGDTCCKRWGKLALET